MFKQFCCLGAKKRRYSPENSSSSQGQAEHASSEDKSLRNGSVSISAPIVLPEPNPDDPVYENSSIEQLTKLCAKQTQENNNHQDTNCADSEDVEAETEFAHGDDIQNSEEDLAKELKDTQEQVAQLLQEADNMSQDLLINAVSRLESVASRLENLARSQPASRTSSTTGDSDVTSPSVVAFDGILNGPIARYSSTSAAIGGDVKTQSEMVVGALQAQRQFLAVVSQCKSPPESTLMELLKPTSDKIAAVQEFREKKRTSPQFNHLSAISESIPALGWVTVSPAPGPYVKEMADAGMFFSNRVLKEFKEKDPQHGDWVKSWFGAMRELQDYIKQFHTTGVAWNAQGGDASAAASTAAPAAPKGGAPPPPPPGPPPPPPPPAPDATPAQAGGAGDDRAALFAALNKGTGITSGLKKVTDDMKTHKNPALRQGPAPFKAPQGPPKPAPKPEAKVAPKPATKPPLTELQGKKWIVEYHTDNKNIILDQTEPKQVVQIFRCTGSTIQIKGKVNCIMMDGCKKTAVVFEDVLTAMEFVNCSSVQAQVQGKVNTVSIDKTDGCMMYLSKDSINAEIVTAKSSEINILVPGADGDYKEFALPEQYKSTWDGKRFVTIPTESM